jgi:hypothetical protein
VRIERDGHYITRAKTPAEVYDIRGSYCAGFVWTQTGQHKAAIWRRERGFIMNDRADMDLVEFMRPFEQRTIQ